MTSMRSVPLPRADRSRHRVIAGGESHEYELYLAVEDIDHTRTKTKSPQTNGICERFPPHRARRVLSGGRSAKKIYRDDRTSCRPISTCG